MLTERRAVVIGFAFAIASTFPNWQASADTQQCGDHTICVTATDGSSGAADSTSPPVSGTGTGFAGPVPTWNSNAGGSLCMAQGGLCSQPLQPAGVGGQGPNVLDLALQARNQLGLLAPQLHMTPDQGRTGVVGLPVWLWVDGPGVKPPPVHATAGTVTVTATATPKSVVWDMGDGNRVPCRGFGTQYTPDRGSSPSPDCGYTYSTTSLGQPNDAFTVTATITWSVTYTSTTGQAGPLPDVTSPVAATSARIGELQLIS